MLTKIINSIENYNISLKTWLLSLSSIIILRIGLESFSSQQGNLFTFNTFPHFFFFFAAAVLSLILIMHFFTKEKVMAISNVALCGWFISLLSPVVDLFFSKGKGNVVIAYLLVDGPQDIIKKYFSFFGDNFEFGITYGIRVQTVLACVLVATYVYLKTKKPLKTVLSAVVVYTTIYIFAVLPALLTMAQKMSLSFNKADMIDVLLLPQKMFEIKHINPNSLFDFKLTLILSIVVVIEVLIWFYVYSQDKFWALIKNTRPLRFVLSGVSLFMGMYIGLRITGTPFENNFYGYLIILNLFLIPFLLWLFSVFQNDLYDLKIDKVSNPNRPLVAKVFSTSEVKNIALACCLLAIGLGFNLGLRFLTLTLILAGLTYLYSTPPIRLRRFPFVSSFVIALSILLTLFMGFMLMAKNQSLEVFPHSIILATLILFTLVVNVKDVKDVKGDPQDKVKTLFTILGTRKGKLILGLLNLISFPTVTALLSQNKVLLFISLGFGALAFLLTYDKKTREGYLFGLYTVFFVLLLVFVY